MQTSTDGQRAWFLDDTPSTRFPLYCRGNVGEIVPEVATPLTSSITTPAFRHVFRSLFAGTGVFRREELDDPAATGGLFGGYLYFNVSMMRTFAVRLPGMKPADIDAQMLGRSTAVPPYVRRPGDRAPARRPLIVFGLGRTALRRRPPDLDAGRAETIAWLRSLPAAPTDDEVVALVEACTDRFASNLENLLVASMGAGIPMSLLERVAGRAEREEPGVFVRALSGLGTIETSRPAAALWSLGRVVASSPSLTAIFDDGVHGIVARLREAGEDRFLRELEAFLAEFGHRGPNEVELASDTWATAPETALAAVERLRLAPDDVDPIAAGRRLADEREAATERILRAVAAPLRPAVRRLLATSARGAARREQAKGTLVLALSGVRSALFSLADRLVDDGVLPDRRSLFMVTSEELPELVRDPATMAEEIAARRARYEALNARVPPFFFDGAVPDPDTWPVRGEAVAPGASASRPESLTGIGVSSGTARGRARIVRDPADPSAIQPGEVLVAPITDPAWTPLFLAAVAVVVEVGALQSHAAIVARELGIPAVVSVEGATARFADGDHLEVDGDRGVVRRLGTE